MKSLAVSVNYASSESPGDTGGLSMPPAFPLRVLDPEGGLIAEAVASAVQQARIAIPSDLDLVFVRLTWPSGRAETQKVNLAGLNSVAIRFTDESISRQPWSAWAVPRMSESAAAFARLAPAEVSVSVDRYNRVWLRLWKFKDRVWTDVPVTPKETYGSVAAKQLDFALDAGSWCLQLGGLHVPWRFISLPGGGPCRVLLTPRQSANSRADPIKVIVTSFRSDAETLLEFLARDSLRAATSLAAFEPLATRLLAEKVEDPVAAVAGAYFLLRTRGSDRIPSWWFDNLTEMFPWIPDAAVIRCVTLIRAGLSSDKEQTRARGLLSECLRRGIPFFAEGLNLLQEAASVLRPQGAPDEDTSFSLIERLSASRAWAGAGLSFYGDRPDTPSPEKVIGYPGNARPQKRRRARRDRISVGMQADRTDVMEDLLDVEFQLPAIEPRRRRSGVAQEIAYDSVRPEKEFLATDSTHKKPKGHEGLYFLGDIKA
jgi:hypothetical protein